MNDQEDILEFLQHSNWIEREYSDGALEDAVAAWDYAYHLLFLTEEHILGIHHLLLRRLRPDIAGKLRDCYVSIGGRNAPAPEESAQMLQRWIGLTNDVFKADSFVNPDELAKQMHIQFEHIHPFEDGNGRVGRIIYNLHRLMFGLPIHIIHEGEEQMQYYKWFR